MGTVMGSGAVAWLLLTFHIAECTMAFRITMGCLLETGVDLSADTMGDFQAGLNFARGCGKEALQGLPPGQKKSFKDLRKAIGNGKKAEAKLNCEDIRVRVPKIIGFLKDTFHPTCAGDMCDFLMVDVRQAFSVQQGFTRTAELADKKRCLAEVMGAQEAHEKLKELFSFVPQVLRAAPSLQGQS